jgi:NAD(P)-dependent dehydrogenase (short-subunit alcohol dehydrogenase family)
MSKIALVTGAGSGVGRASALTLQKNGWSVVVVGRRHAELEKTVAMGDAAGGRLLAVPCDVTQPAAVAELFERIAAEFGPVVQ